MLRYVGQEAATVWVETDAPCEVSVRAGRAEGRAHTFEVAGPVFGAGLLGLTVGALAFGPIADRFGRKPVIIVSSLTFGGFAFATPAVQFADSRWTRRAMSSKVESPVRSYSQKRTSSVSPQRVYPHPSVNTPSCWRATNWKYLVSTPSTRESPSATPSR